MESTKKQFKIGDKVNWEHDPLFRCNYVLAIAAIVVYQTKKKVKIMIARKINEEWVRETRFVEPHKLSIRNQACKELGE